MNVKKIISLIMLLFMLLPLGAQNSEGKQRYKIAACDWMMLKRQKIGSFQLMKELGGDGIEMDMGGLGKRDTLTHSMNKKPETIYTICKYRWSAIIGSNPKSRFIPPNRMMVKGWTKYISYPSLEYISI